jgi:hypothetical protein
MSHDGRSGRRCAVASPGLTRRPLPRAPGACEEDGQDGDPCKALTGLSTLHNGHLYSRQRRGRSLCVAARTFQWGVHPPSVISLDSEDGRAACTVEVRICCFAPVA